MTIATVPATARTAPTRMVALWVPDWPVLAAMTAADVPAHRPAAVHDGRRTTAVSAPARAQGVRRGMRRRHAQECCPDLVMLTADAGRDVRLFEPVAAAAETVVSGIEIARPGLLLLPAGGAGRYHGSEQALAAELLGAVAELAGYEAQVGMADGAGAAIMASRASRIVPSGDTPAFLAPLGIGELVHASAGGTDVVELVDLLGRLGLRTLGDLARLPRPDVVTRFGRLGAWAHQVAAGDDDRPTALRRVEPDIVVDQELDPPVERIEATAFVARRLAEALHERMVARGVGFGRLQIIARTDDGQELVRAWRTDAALGGLSVARMTDRVRWQLEGWLTGHAIRSSGGSGAADPEPAPLVRLTLRAEEVTPAGAEQGRLWGGPSGADLRAHRAVHRVQGLIGGEAVLSANLQGGRDVRDQVHLVPWGEDRPPARPATAPWPGRLPPPAPATVLRTPQLVQVCDTAGRKVEVDVRLQLSGDPAVVWWPPADGVEREAAVTGWAGPWPVVQRWWSETPDRQVYLQAVLDGGGAVLLALRAGVWQIEALYD